MKQKIVIDWLSSNFYTSVEIKHLKIFEAILNYKINTDDLLELFSVFKSYKTNSNTMDLSGITCYVSSTMLGHFKGYKYEDFRDKIYGISYVYAHLDKMFDSCNKSFKRALYEISTTIIRDSCSDEQIDQLVHRTISETMLKENNIELETLTKVLKIGRDRSSTLTDKILLSSLMKYEAKNSASLEHACSKGGITLMLVDNAITEGGVSSSFTSSNYLFGAAIQLDDDMRDIKIDLEEGNPTYASHLASTGTTEEFDNYVLSTLFILSKIHEPFEHLIIALTYSFIDASLRSGRCSQDVVDIIKRYHFVPQEIDTWSIIIKHCHTIVDVLTDGITTADDDVDIDADIGRLSDADYDL